VCSMIFKAISRTGVKSCFVDVILAAANGWLCRIFRFLIQLFLIQLKLGLDQSGFENSLRFTDKSRFTSSRPEAVLVAPISVKTKKQQQIHLPQTALTQKTQYSSAFFNMTSTSSRSSAGTVRTLDLRISLAPRSQEQHRGLCFTTLQEASVTLQTIILGVGGTTYNNHTLEHFKERGVEGQLPSLWWVVAVLERAQYGVCCCMPCVFWSGGENVCIDGGVGTFLVARP